MKMQKVSRWFSFLLFITMVAGCTQSTESEAAPSVAIPTSFASPTTKSTATLIMTDTPATTNTLTSVPTLSVEDARKRLLDLLATNSDCRLPCLWSITPGKSTYQEAQSILSPLSSISNVFEIEPSFDPTGGFVIPSYTEGVEDLILSARVSYLSKNQIVNRVHFQVLEEEVVKDTRDPSGKSWLSKTPIYGLSTFIKRVEYYSLSHLLTEQGIPASVMIASSGPSFNRGGSIFTHIAVLYPNQGIWAEYTTLVNENEVGSNIISCPVNAHIEMELYPTGNPNSFYALLEKTDWGITKDSYKPLEEATSMSLEEFYQTFRNSTDKCIETPTNLWPTPER